MLTQQDLKSVLSYDKDSGKFKWIKGNRRTTFPGDLAGGVDKQGYILIQVFGRKYRAHRLAWLYETGQMPDLQLDHINRIKSDNRFCNLREVDCAANRQNCEMQSNNTSGVRGVSWHKTTRLWRASISVNGVRHALGYFENIDDAQKARDDAESLHHPFYTK